MIKSSVRIPGYTPFLKEIIQLSEKILPQRFNMFRDPRDRMKLMLARECRELRCCVGTQVLQN